ncbi:scarecrow-like protein 33 [Impatiens glandulifera]|uniref:scarecrow-like protein 33 n=1 Tax=Impatiens glandulifera TaxID=253017 RepID=UPI001FB14A71|nr:scarecrow-like protein 33 [Impatiens glandulifera]
MEPTPNEFSADSLNGVLFYDEINVPAFDPTQDFENIFKFRGDDDPLDLSFMENPSPMLTPDTNHVVSTSTESLDLDSPVEDLSVNLLEYINQILMEENFDEKPSMFHDPLALEATEKSLYDALGEKYPPSLDDPLLIFRGDIDSPDSNIFGSLSENSTSSNITNSDPGWIVDPERNLHQVHNDDIFNFSFQAPALASSNLTVNSANRLTGSSISNHMIPDLFSEGESILQFRRGVEEASKFLPTYNHIAIDLDSYKLPLESNMGDPVKVENAEQNLSYSLKGGKNHRRDDSHLEERSNKQSAIFRDNIQEAELSDLFDKVLLYDGQSCCDDEKGVKNEETKSLQQNGQRPGKKTRSRKQANNNKEVIDLNTLLLSCAQSVSVDDRRTAYEQLKQIRQHSSSTGDVSQRLAHVFANGIEARLAGTGSEIYQAIKSKRISAIDKLKAYQVYIKACPFKKVTVYFTCKMILDLVCNSSKKKLHIVDFGILYGFQWPMLIQFLSMLPREPPELRITGIEYPQSGFRPLELVQETGRRLERYCERFGIRFKYHAIAQNWETIKTEDLQLSEDEDLVVNTHFRFKNLLDETVVPDSPRDAVLKLIKDMNPDIFLHTDINGSYTSPFFFTRFKEALFHYSLLFDMFDVNITPEEQARITFELEFYGREILNVIACEGVERVERPETYKQWNIRNTRHGFKILPIKEELMKKLRGKAMEGYHKDFVVDEDSHWLLQGWKGRIFCASSCWVPAKKAL